MTDQDSTPDGWRRTTLGELGRYINGRGFKTSEWSTTGRPIIRIQDLTGSNRNPHFYDGEVQDRYVVRKGDLLVSWSATLGAYIWEGPEAVLNQHIFKVESKIDRRLHYHLIRGCLAELQQNAHGSGIVHITRRLFDDLPVIVPVTVKAQRDLAATLDIVEQRLRSARVHVSNGYDTMERLRRTFLAAASAGRLTADWRTEHGLVDSGDRPAAWQLVRFGDVCTRVTVGHVGKMVSEYRKTGVPFLRSQNVRELRFDPAGLKFISPEFHRQLKKSALVPGDIVIVRSGFVGTACVIPAALKDANCSDLVIARPGDRLVAEFGAIYINSPRMRAHVSEVQVGSAQAHFNTKSMAAAPILLPPADEQTEIVRRVHLLLQVVDAIDERLRRASDEVLHRSSQAVLAKAFRGSLSVGAAS
jgi:type I restriction enzyme, S subunit